MKKVLAILGPTATGKTDLALKLAKKFNGELISCDSRQVYIGLDIGTGKYPSKKEKIKRKKRYWEIGGIRVWMYDVIDPRKQYTAAHYVKDASRVVGEIRKKGKRPIIVGGTGLYLKVLLDGLSNLTIPVDKKLREKLNELSISQLQEKLKKLSIAKWEKMNNSDRQNPRRLIRAIELESGKGNKGSKGSQGLEKEFNILKIGLNAPRQILYKKVDEWVISRMKQGMVKEAKKMHEQGLTFKRMKELGLEYRVLADYLEGRIKSIEGDQGLINIMQRKIHGYVRRQITWFKKEQKIIWFDISNKNSQNKIEKLADRWYDSHKHYAAKS